MTQANGKRDGLILSRISGMPMPTSPTRLFVCDACGATLPVEPEHAGRKCRCGRCGKILVVPGDSPKPPPVATPKYVGFNCLLCDTRLSARVEDVGLQAKCPDCGRLTKVPQPPKPRKKKTPEAMHGQQYGLWGVDEAPPTKEIAARQPKYYPVWCRVCDTLMHARAEQVGKKLACPDCGAKTLFKKLPVEKETKSALVADGEEYQLDETFELPRRPAYQPPQARNINEIDAQEDAMRQEYRERGQMPENPLIGGVHKMLIRSPLPEATFVLAVVLALELWFIATAMTNIGGIGVLLLLLPFITVSVFGLLSLMAASAFWLAVLKESSEGNDRLYHPPGPVFVDWVRECFYVVFSAAMSIAPGMLLWKFAPNLPAGVGPAAAAIGGLGLFPIFLLSQLENGSPMEFFSPKLAGTLLKRPRQWLLFYAETVLVIGGSAATIVSLSLLSANTLPASVLLAAGASFLYFRLLGRLAWWLAESLPLPEETDG